MNGDPINFSNLYSTPNPTLLTAGRYSGRLSKSGVIEQYSNMDDDDRALFLSYKTEAAKRLIGKKRKEATATDIRQFAKQFKDAKAAEWKSWLDNEVFDLVDMRKLGKIKNYVTGRWVLTIKRDKDG